VTPDGDSQAHHFHGQAAQDKGSARRLVGEQHDRCEGEKESGWHHQQTGVFHGPFLNVITGEQNPVRTARMASMRRKTSINSG
jgi:hypothetical protein